MRKLSNKWVKSDAADYPIVRRKPRVNFNE